jgi:hypothetical protein
MSELYKKKSCSSRSKQHSKLSLSLSLGSNLHSWLELIRSCRRTNCRAYPFAARMGSRTEEPEEG